MKLILEILLFLLSAELDRRVDHQDREEVAYYMKQIISKLDPPNPKKEEVG